MMEKAGVKGLFVGWRASPWGGNGNFSRLSPTLGCGMTAEIVHWQRLARVSLTSQSFGTPFKPVGGSGGGPASPAGAADGGRGDGVLPASASSPRARTLGDGNGTGTIQSSHKSQVIKPQLYWLTPPPGENRPASSPISHPSRGEQASRFTGFTRLPVGRQVGKCRLPGQECG